MAKAKNKSQKHDKSSYSLYDKHKQRKYLNEAERRCFYDKAVQCQQHIKLFLLMLYWTGARISEVLNMVVSDIDFSDETIGIKCLKKRNKIVFRHIVLPKSYLVELKEYVLNKKADDLLWSFCRRTGLRYVKTVMTACDLTGSKATATGLRHSLAVACVLKGVNLTTIRKIMGHASVATTTIYTDIVGTEEREFISRIWHSEKNESKESESFYPYQIHIHVHNHYPSPPS